MEFRPRKYTATQVLGAFDVKDEISVPDLFTCGHYTNVLLTFEVASLALVNLYLPRKYQEEREERKGLEIDHKQYIQNIIQQVCVLDEMGSACSKGDTLK